MGGFEDFQDLVTGMAQMADLCKISYEGFVAKGFSEKHAIELTKQVMHEIMAPIFTASMENAMEGMQQALGGQQ